MHAKGPPPEAGTWPFAVLLQYCMVNGLGCRRGERTWTAKTLSAASWQGSSGFEVRTVEAWMQGQNVPRSENWPTLLGLLTNAEPERYRRAWQRRLEAARDLADAQTRQRYLKVVRDFRELARERASGASSFRELLRQIEKNHAKNQEENENRALVELDAEAQRIGSQLGNLAPQVATKAREAEEARQDGHYDEAEARLQEATALLVEPARDAQALSAALAAVHALRGRLNHDRDLFEEAASAFFNALSVVPFAETESRVRYEVLYWRSLNLALIGAQHFDAASKLLQPCKGLGLKPNVVTFSIWMHKARDYDQAKGVLDQMLAAGVAPDEVTFSTLMAKARDYDQAKGVLDQMLAAGVAPNEVTFNTLMAKARDYDQAKGVLDQMLAAGVAPNEVTATTLATFMSTLAQATGATQRLNPHRATGPAYFNKVLAQLAPQHEATELLGWAFSTATAFGFSFSVGQLRRLYSRLPEDRADCRCGARRVGLFASRREPKAARRGGAGVQGNPAGAVRGGRRRAAACVLCARGAARGQRRCGRRSAVGGGIAGLRPAAAAGRRPEADHCGWSEAVGGRDPEPQEPSALK
jgi:pentatricopeptide repeat protein